MLLSFGQTVFGCAAITLLDEAPCIDKMLEAKLERSRLGC
jgi:hypothetical protein